MKSAIQSIPLKWKLRSVFLLLAVYMGVLASAQSSPFKIAFKLYPVDLLHNKYNALHAGVEGSKYPFSLHLSYGRNGGIKLSSHHDSYQKGYKYKAGVRFYLSSKDLAGTMLPSTFIQLIHSYLDYSQQRQNDYYKDPSGMEWRYQSAQLRTRRSGVEVQAGKNLIVYQRLMIEASAGLMIGHITNEYSNLTGVTKYDRLIDNPAWLLAIPPKYRNEGRTSLIAPSASLGITYWLW